MNFEHLWNEFHQSLRKFIAQKVHHHADVDDILQTVFIKINAHSSDLKNIKNLQSWIFHIARNTIIDFYRTKKVTEQLHEHISLSNEYSELNFSREAALCIRSTMQRLPDKYREALEFSELQGLSQKALSEKLGISYSGIKSRVQRGRKMLKTQLEDCCHIESDIYGNIVDFRILKD